MVFFLNREEWQLINEICCRYKEGTSHDKLQNLKERFNLKCQYRFIEDILNAAQSLKISLGKHYFFLNNSSLIYLNYFLDINQEHFNDLKLYTNNIIEINKEISLIIIYPPSEQICIIPNTEETPTASSPTNNNNYNNFNNIANISNITQSFFKRNSIMTTSSTITTATTSYTKYDHRASITNNYQMYLPIQIFETLNLFTYDRLFIKTYSKLSTLLEIEYNSTLQYQREAFSNEELNLTKQKLVTLTNYQHKLDDIWKESRWLIDIINSIRDRNKITGVPLDFINEFSEVNLKIALKENENSCNNRILTKIPSVVVQNENDIEEQTSTLIINDDLFNSEDLSYLNNSFKNNNNNNGLPKRMFEMTNLEKSDLKNNENLYSSISYINLKNINKMSNTTTKVNFVVQNISPTSSSTSTSSISASASSASSTSSAYYVCPYNNQKITFDDDHKNDAVELLFLKSSNSNETSNFLHTAENFENEPIELNYSKHLTQPDTIPAIQNNNQITSLTQSFSSLIASVYNYKTIVVHLAIDSITNQQQFKMVNFKINSNTTSSDVIKHTLNAYDINPTTTTNKASFNRDEAACESIKSPYCLVIVLGCRERVLKDNYCLFNLKDPWIHGRFYIRLVHDALAALKLDKKFSTMKELNNSFNNNLNNLASTSINTQI